MDSHCMLLSVRHNAVLMNLMHQQIMSSKFVNHLTTGASAITSWLRQALMSVARIGTLWSTSCCWCSHTSPQIASSLGSCAPLLTTLLMLHLFITRPATALRSSCFWQPSATPWSATCREGLQGSLCRRLSWTPSLDHVCLFNFLLIIYFYFFSVIVE